MNNVTPCCQNCFKTIYTSEYDQRFCSNLCLRVYEVGMKCPDNLHRVSSDNHDMKISRSPTSSPETKKTRKQMNKIIETDERKYK